VVGQLIGPLGDEINDDDLVAMVAKNRGEQIDAVGQTGPDRVHGNGGECPPMVIHQGRCYQRNPHGFVLERQIYGKRLRAKG